MSDELNYGSYLALDELLHLQRPRSRPEHPDELLFIVVHQSSELWFKVLLRDLHTLADAFTSGNGGLALWQLHRINGLMRIVSAQLSSLALLPPQHFAEFREGLGTSSGSQSVQFRAIEAASGLREQWFLDLVRAHGPVPDAVQHWLDQPTMQDLFLGFLEHEGVSLEALYLGPGPTLPFFIAEALLEYEMEFGQWRFKHAQLVERMLGPMTAGTGGSSGASMLHRTASIRYFPKLAEVRARFFGTNVPPLPPS
ncbi:MAG TPA: tryptophan 2,3-dioxygenase family protein [Gemmatimonadaceae bacterium]|nr:tryptophan 2,3-dioxygenase family protein [Gemmatimonadaceae bacterium]